MSGLWYTQFYNNDREGTCPLQWWTVSGDEFKIRMVSKAATPNVYRDWEVTGKTEHGQLKTWPALRPIDYDIVSTDYSSYAIIYRCS